MHALSRKYGRCLLQSNHLVKRGRPSGEGRSRTVTSQHSHDCPAGVMAQKLSLKLLFFTGMPMSVAWLGSVIAAPKLGHWEGGNPGAHDPFWICLNVSADSKRLTAQNTQCKGNHGDDRNSIHLEFQGGVHPRGRGSMPTRIETLTSAISRSRKMAPSE